MKLTFSAPSKTFLVGEYAVLQGGPALVLNTEPRFELRASPGSGRVSGIPVGSPAYRWLEERSSVFGVWDVEFHDPHAGAGGFGASGAQFLFAHSFTTLLQASVGRALEGLDLKTLLQDFKKFSSGSGSDILSQSVGAVAQLSGGVGEARAWPFAELDFSILRTGKKVATHEHLKELSAEVVAAFLPLAQAAIEAFAAEAAPQFLDCVGAYASRLRESGLQTEHTVQLLEKAAAHDWCLAAKGCGALGADTLLLIFAAADLPHARAFAEAHGLPFAGSRAELSSGLKMEWS